MLSTSSILVGFGVLMNHAVPVAPAPSPLHVAGTQVLDSANHRVRLRGVNICSLEWMAEGDHVLQSVDEAIDNWHANIIRLPLSQDRWFGKSADTAHGGEVAYRGLVKKVVDKIRAKRAYVILDLHWSDGGVWGQDIGQHQYPDDNSVDFWKSCASAFANDPAVIFDLYNEPFGDSWTVWRDGGPAMEKFNGKDLKYRAVGLQTLLQAVRSTGAKNVIHAGGLGYSSRLDFPESALLKDPKGNGVVYVSHFYPGWENVPSWESRIEKAKLRLPLFVEEFGDDAPSAPLDTPAHRIGQILAVIKRNDFNWTAWCMHTAARPCLISDWNYTPTPEFGALVKLALNGQVVPIAPRRTTAPDFKVFDGKLEDPWQSWSSAKLDFASTEPGYTSKNAIKVTLGASQQVQLGTVPFDGLAYDSLSFWVKATPGNSLHLNLGASIMDNGKPTFSLRVIGDRWTNITATFDQLGIKDQEDIKSFVIRNSDGIATSEFFLDNIQLIGKK